jgi:hypothetical protein
MRAHRQGGSRSFEPRSTSSTYRIADHRAQVTGREGSWNVDLDDRSLPAVFATEAEAWEAAVHEVDRLDRPATG